MRVDPDGPIPCDLALFGEAPGFEEQQQGRGFVGRSGQQLWSDMKRFTGLTREQFYVSNIVKEGLPKNRDPKPAEIAAALPEFLDEILTVRPRVLVAAGGFATRAVLGSVLVSNVHGIPHEAEIAGHQFICVPIYHPAAGLHNKGFLAAFAYDLGRLDAFLRGTLRPWAPRTDVETSWVSEAAVRFCKGFPPQSVVAVDTEGWREQPWGLSFSPDGLHGFVISTDESTALSWFEGWIADKDVVCHNGIHDLPVLRALGVHSITRYHDTQVLAYHDIIRSGSGVLEAESQNLGTLAYRECELVLGELTNLPGVDLAARVIPYTPDTMRYAGMDPIATWRLFEVYRQRGLVYDYRPYAIDMGQVPLVAEMMEHGIPFDADATMEYYAEVLEKLEAVTEDLKKRAARFGNRDFNPGSHPQVREILTKKIGLRIRKRTKGGLASTNEKALADHAKEPFVEKLQEYRELQKLKGTYVKPLLEELL